MCLGYLDTLKIQFKLVPHFRVRRCIVSVMVICRQKIMSAFKDKSLENIFKKLYINIKHHETIHRVEYKNHNSIFIFWWSYTPCWFFICRWQRGWVSAPRVKDRYCYYHETSYKYIKHHQTMCSEWTEMLISFLVELHVCRFFIWYLCPLCK